MFVVYSGSIDRPTPIPNVITNDTLLKINTYSSFKCYSTSKPQEKNLQAGVATQNQKVKIWSFSMRSHCLSGSFVLSSRH